MQHRGFLQLPFEIKWLSMPTPPDVEVMARIRARGHDYRQHLWRASAKPQSKQNENWPDRHGLIDG